jgi:hypothetical protein
MSDQTMVYEFIRANPGATTKAIGKGARVRHERVTAILAEGVAAGELVMTAGARNAKFYDVAGNHSIAPIPEALVPEAPIPVPAVLPPNFGLAFLRPGPAFVGSQRPRSPTNAEPAPEQWLVELQRRCRPAAEQGIRDAKAKMAKTPGTLAPVSDAEPVDPVVESLLRETRNGADHQVNPTRFIVG